MTGTMKNLFLILALFQSFLCNAQVVNKEIRKGNKEYGKKAYSEAEIHYRKALEKSPETTRATFNLADALYKEGQYEPSITKFEALTKTKNSNSQLSKYYYNLGNAYFQSKKMDDAVNAYKQSLRLNPKDQDDKHNLQFALKVQKEKQNDDQNKDNEKKASDFAKALKKKAQEFVLERKYGEAYQLMIDGEKKDATVELFHDFTERIKDVRDINNH
jgi:Ca-activated chloride channel homolog